MHQRIKCETSEGDMSASSSTGSVQMSADSTAASTDSITAPVEMRPSAISGVVKLGDIPLPADRPHTISSAVYQPPVRPPIISDTFEPPTLIAAVSGSTPSNVADIYSRPSLVSRDSWSSVAVTVATPTVPVTTNSVPCDDCTDGTSGNIHPLSDSSQHLHTVPSALQKRKAVSLTDYIYIYIYIPVSYTHLTLPTIYSV